MEPRPDASLGLGIRFPRLPTFQLSGVFRNDDSQVRASAELAARDWVWIRRRYRGQELDGQSRRDDGPSRRETKRLGSLRFCTIGRCARTFREALRGFECSRRIVPMARVGASARVSENMRWVIECGSGGILSREHSAAGVFIYVNVGLDFVLRRRE
jgi:hypothetical protein